jgi:hypothetical protein
MSITVESLQSKRSDLLTQSEQHIGQINRINGAIALLDDLILEMQQNLAAPAAPAATGMMPPAPRPLLPVTYEALEEDAA